MMIFFQTRLTKILIWQNFSQTWESDFKWIVIAAVKLRASVTNEAINYLSSIKDNHENYHIFTSSSSCYASVMKQSVNSIILNSKKDTARIVKTSIVKTVKLQAALSKKKLSRRIFSGNIQSNCSFEIFREEHYHMTLSNKTPPWRFLRKRDMLRLFFETDIS